MTINSALLDGVLKGDLGFDGIFIPYTNIGFLITDYDGIGMAA
jgi:beta-glucosidase-like glycosyl hydrolase